MSGPIIVLLLAAVAAGQQFDLVCTGSERLDLAADPAPTSFRLHVDLAQRRWCEDDCPAILPIADVQPAFIAFELETPEQQALGQINSRVVSRETGKFLRYVRRPNLGGRVIAIDATCAPAPFTGFPQRSTKF